MRRSKRHASGKTRAARQHKREAAHQAQKPKTSRRAYRTGKRNKSERRVTRAGGYAEKQVMKAAAKARRKGRR